jgi:hypothetical protein
MDGRKLTQAQKDALRVLAAKDGEEVRSWKRSSQLEPIASVNIRAADGLVDKKLARIHFPFRWSRLPSSVFVSENKYSITDEGREAAAELFADAA